MVWKTLDLTGQKFGKLTAIEKAGKNKRHSILWKCVCDCNNENIKYVAATDLRLNRVKSCGCIHRFPAGMANFYKVYHSYKKGAEKRGLEWKLNKRITKELFKGNCYYCGIGPSSIRNDDGSNGEFRYNGIDRVDNKKGYILSNVVTCCEMCNRGKWNKSEKEFIDWIYRIYNNYIKNRFYEGKITINIK